MLTFDLALVDAAGALQRPLLSVRIERRLVPRFLLAVRALQSFVPVRVLCEGHLVTSVEFGAEGAVGLRARAAPRRTP